MNIKWTIENLVVDPQINGKPDVVVSAGWRVTAERNELRGTSYGRVQFPPPQGERFTAYANLTEETILGWVWEIGRSTEPLDEWSKEIAEQQAIDSLLQQEKAVTEKPLPWIPLTPTQPERATLEQRTEALEMLVDYLLEGPNS
jgi:hypothetical protein